MNGERDSVMNTGSLHGNHWKFYINLAAGIFFVLFIRSIFLLTTSPDYFVQDGKFIFTAKPGVIALLWSVAILCGMIFPYLIYKLLQSIKMKDSLVGNLFQVLIAIVIVGILLVSVFSVKSLENIRVMIGPESFAYEDADWKFSTTWDIENISAHYMPWYSTGEYTDEYSWIDLCATGYSLHVPLNYIGGVDTLINQSYLYWQAYNS